MKKIIIAQMSNVYKPQRQFIIILFTTLMCLRGKANFRNLSRLTWGSLIQKPEIKK
jgi:hypothetical protein